MLLFDTTSLVTAGGLNSKDAIPASFPNMSESSLPV